MKSNRPEVLLLGIDAGTSTIQAAVVARAVADVASWDHVREAAVTAFGEAPIGGGSERTAHMNRELAWYGPRPTA